MDRRNFIRTTGTLIAGARLAPHALGETSASALGRTVLPMNRRWRYSPKSVPGGHDRQFDDTGLQRVVVPHTNKSVPWHGFDDTDYEFVSLYRRHFKLPKDARGKRVFVDFEGVMTASTVWINGERLGEYKGGYTPFSFELTASVDWDGDNVLAVDVDSSERSDIPPFGNEIDYLTFGGIYREVWLRIVPQTFIENVFVRTKDVLSANPAVDVECFLENVTAAPLNIDVELLDGDQMVGKASFGVPPMARKGKPSAAMASAAPGASHTVSLRDLGNVKLWGLEHRNLYTVRVRLTQGTQVLDEDTRRFGFRDARFTDHGFELNGKVIKLRGLDRHQTFPFVGQAMPGRVQRRDADVLRNKLHCNIVRTSHYPQSRHFLDACDDFGLLVLEEIPGWQYIGNKEWQDVAVRNVGEMIRRDWNHPSIVLWGVRINESQDNHDFYVRTNELAHQLDDARQTGGIRYLYDSETLEDVFTMNDFGFPLKTPNHPLYLNTEFSGHMFSTKRFDNVTRVAEHVLRHARVHNQLAGDDRYAGGIGWCAFDYNTHGNFGSGDRICYHGVSDIFRIPKPAAYVYKSQCDPSEEIVLEPAFFWSSGDKSEAGGTGPVPICSNCDHLKIYLNGRLKWEVDPDRKNYGNLKHPPFIVDIHDLPLNPWGDLKIEGYIKGKLAKTVTLSGSGVDADLKVEPDHQDLVGDGRDVTRVVLRVTDEYGNIRPFATGAVSLSLNGPGEIIGENPFSLAGGAGAVWIRTKEATGTIRLEARHPYLKSKTIEIRVTTAPRELV